ncbi:MAG: UbiD family decarboxylase domain-containing protein [Gammaproteobacteria bacterium]
MEHLHEHGELVRVSRQVSPVYELPGLLKQAEARRKAILFESVQGSDFPVAGGLLTSAGRFAHALGGSAADSLEQHWDKVQQAIIQPIAFENSVNEGANAPCKDTVLRGDRARVADLPVSTFFEGDSGPFITAALGISKNIATDTFNCGYYRVQLLEDGRVIVNVSERSGLKAIFNANHAKGKTTPVALVIGAPPALLMAAAARVPADVSELDVAGALAGSPLKTVKAESFDLPVPVEAEFVIETEVDCSEQLENTMGEYGDTYGTQLAPVAHVRAITHRECPIYHCIMAGAGKEHNSLGMHILCGVEPDLKRQLNELIPGIASVHIDFDPPRMGATGQIILSCNKDMATAVQQVCRTVYSLICDGYPMARIIRQIILVDTDIDISNRIQVQWACTNRAVEESDYLFFKDITDSLKTGIDARAADREMTRRLVIPGAETISLDDYLD